MKLRHVLLLACALGACGALLLAWDMHRRLKDAESSPQASSQEPAAKSQEPGAKSFTLALPPDSSALSMLAVHALGLLSLAFLFLAIFLLLISALRERAFAFAIDGESTARPVSPPSPTLPPEVGKDALPVVMPLSEVAKQEDYSTGAGP
jgi:hypothetical protein